MTQATRDHNSSSTSPECGCPDFDRTRVSRRSVLAGATVLGGAMAVSQMFGEAMMQATFAGTKGGNTLVVISLRGGVDGLGVVVPHGDPGYYRVRPTTAVAASALVCADPMFGLHPSMSPLAPLWASGELAAIQATGLPIVNRSHFAAIEEVENANPGSSLRSGWVNRMIGLGAGASVTDGVQLGQNFPTTATRGDAQVLSTTHLDWLQLCGINGRSTQRYGSISTAWSGATGPLARAMNEAVSVSKGAGAQLKAVTTSTTAYPTVWNASPYASPLKNAAKLIRADLGTDVIAIDAGNWDLHTNYGTLQWGSMQSNIDGFAQSLKAFFDDLGDLRSRVTVVTISEFGRRVAENGSQGFDHGWGNMMLVAGAGVKGGQYYGQWPGLDSNALADGDLKVTTDYRNVLGEIVARRFPDRSLPALFPGLSYEPVGFMA